MDERWAPVVGYEDQYLVSSFGRVQSLLNSQHKPRRTEYFLSIQINKRGGYPTVCLSRDGKQLFRPIHALVLEAFVGPRPEGMVARHRNGIPTESTVENLIWGSISENARDRIMHGRHEHAAKTHCQRGHPLSGNNLYIQPNGIGRGCRACRNLSYKKRRSADRASKSEAA